MELIRIEYGKTETIGVLRLFGEVLCYTLELPWKDNQNDISCIPLGIYECIIAKYHDKDKWLIQNVPNRTGVFIHAGNTHKDILGCILLGSNVGYMGDNRAVLGSANAVNEFMVKTKGFTELKIEIKEA